MNQMDVDERIRAVSVGHGSKSVRVREQVIVALLTHRTLADAAVDSGIGESTLRRWLKNNPEFRDAYQRARQELLDSTSNSLRIHAFEAVEVLTKIVSDAIISPATRISACRAVLEFAFHSAQLEQLSDISERLTNLEVTLNKQQWRTSHV